MSSVYDHPEWRAFVNAIREQPDDDTPRLVAADWLDERREADRAELIRVQVAIASHERRTGDKLIAGPEVRRERELLKGKRSNFGGIWVQIGEISLLMSRGFAEWIDCEPHDWLGSGDRLLQREPIRKVKLASAPDAEVDRVNRLRAWKKPLEWGADVMRTWEAEWPGIVFDLPPLVQLERTRANVLARLAEVAADDRPVWNVDGVDIPRDRYFRQLIDTDYDIANVLRMHNRVAHVESHGG